MRRSGTRSRARAREASAPAWALGTLALALAPLAGACTPTPPAGAVPEARPEARTTGRGEGCRCGLTEEGDACECPHCAGMRGGFEPGACRCRNR